MSTDHDWSELDALVKERYETGAHGGCHIAVPDELWLAIQARDLPRPAPKPAWAPDLGQLLGLPIVLDADLGEGEWRLVESTTRRVVKSGTTLPAGATP